MNPTVKAGPPLKDTTAKLSIPEAIGCLEKEVEELNSTLTALYEETSCARVESDTVPSENPTSMGNGNSPLAVGINSIRCRVRDINRNMRQLINDLELT